MLFFLSKTAMDYLPLDTTKDMTHSFEKQRQRQPTGRFKETYDFYLPDSKVKLTHKS
jgi:hypothetical protein